ncbi:MAG: HD domain-containing protein [Chlamydiales bacterium]|nr:HD domain-containing protein [Chlamydiia bacterium]MCP5507604.1 HD domain-containing protein [Chlamydiales bacterium]
MTKTTEHIEALTEYRDQAQMREEVAFHPKAAFSANHSRYNGAELDHRLPYKRDVDRIIHSKAYARYIDKTQVVYLVENDHITHRGLHVQLVSNFARGIAEILRLNLDLVEAIALGHDVGHPPFGHEGENYLSSLSKEYGNGPFSHPSQSCRLFSVIEPLNLGLNVYDGFLCHDGGMKSNTLVPQWDKNWDDHLADLERKAQDPETNIMPTSLEGCLVKLSDTMSYVGRDIEDAISLGIIERSQVPDTLLGTTNRQILSTLAADIISNSYGKDYIALSDEAFAALKELRTFNFRNIYIYPKLKIESTKIKRSYRILFETLLAEYEKEGEDSYLWKKFVLNKSDSYKKDTAPVQMVIDFIAGMTDSYFIRTLQKIIIPSRIELS